MRRRHTRRIALKVATEGRYYGDLRRGRQPFPRRVCTVFTRCRASRWYPWMVVPASGRIGERVQPASIGDLHVTAVGELHDAEPLETRGHPAQGLLRQPQVTRDVGAAHGQPDGAGLGLLAQRRVALQHLQERRELARRVAPRNADSLPLRFPELVGNLAQEVKLQREIPAERVLQRVDADAVQRRGRQRLRVVDVAAAFGQAEDVGGKQERDHALLAVPELAIRLHYAARDDENRLRRVALAEEDRTSGDEAHRGDLREVPLLLIGQQLGGQARGPGLVERNRAN